MFRTSAPGPKVTRALLRMRVFTWLAVMSMVGVMVAISIIRTRSNLDIWDGIWRSRVKRGIDL